MRECLESLARQTHPAIELVLVDNASRDASWRICREFAAAHLGLDVRLFHFDETVPMGANWNRCIERASGPWIKLVPCDDILEPDCVAQQVEVALREAGVAWIGCAKTVINGAGRRLFEVSRLRAGRHPGEALARRGDACAARRT